MGKDLAASSGDTAEYYISSTPKTSHAHFWMQRS